ncbi:MAG: ornithine carbamoyltransferase [Candidatus Micrarchaeota archaeon]|nr:ornithine carbamoyltransferase [Candidatus Micrarchaeota archaeon]
MQHLLTMKELNGKQIENLIDKAIEIKKNQQKWWNSLDHKTLAMIFQKTSTRTRVSFEVGMTQLGGHAIFMDWRTTQFTMSDIKDESKCLSRFVDIIMARLVKHSDLQKMADASGVPVINGLCEKYHPCQSLGDLMTIKEHKGKLNGLKVVYLGIGNNVSNTLSLACTRTGMNFTLCAPEMDPPCIDEELLKEVKGSGLYEEEKDPKKAVQGADVVYTDTWVNMEVFTDPKFEKEKERRMKTFVPYQLNRKLVEGTDALVMHDMPIHKGYEIDEWSIYSPNSIIFDQGENRLHIQKAIMLWLLGKIKL